MPEDLVKIIERGREQLGEVPDIDVEQEFERLVEWVRENKGALGVGAGRTAPMVMNSVRTGLSLAGLEGVMVVGGIAVAVEVIAYYLLKHYWADEGLRVAQEFDEHTAELEAELDRILDADYYEAQQALKKAEAVELGKDVQSTTKQRAGASRPPQHHVYPQALRKFFKLRGIDVDAYVIDLTQGVHEALHYEKLPSDRRTGGWWNKTIVNRIRKVERILRRRLHADEVHFVRDQMLREAGISGPLHYYRMDAPELSDNQSSGGGSQVGGMRRSPKAHWFQPIGADGHVFPVLLWAAEDGSVWTDRPEAGGTKLETPAVEDARLK